jgi:tRNA-2-methylthio-N6-dimethylallyladenosine synthase
VDGEQLEPVALAYGLDAIPLLLGRDEAFAVTASSLRDAHDSDRATRSRAIMGGRSVNMQKRYHLTTFGCQMNEHDSERMKGMLESLGYAESPTRDQADLILFNTCSIRERADNRFLAHLGEAKRLKLEQPERVVGIGGCWAQSVKDEVFARFPFVDVAFGPGQVHKLAEFLTSDSLTAQGYFEFEGFTGRLPAKREREFQGWVQISVGCNCRCSYCIVPSTRGREVSRPPSELVDEVRGLAADGVREVTLLGQNVNSYGRDLPREQRITFAELLREIDAVEGIARIRYTSPHPKDMREDVIRAHAELPSLCQHIHLPLQSGSSTVLKRMRRTYNRERYLDRVALIREHVPDCAITTDIIVGFPGRPSRISGRPSRRQSASAMTAPSRSPTRRDGGPRRPHCQIKCRMRSRCSGSSGWWK